MPPQSLAQVPLDSKWHWQELGLCRGADPLLFFHTQNERGFSRSRRDQLAQKYTHPIQSGRNARITPSERGSHKASGAA